MQLATYHKKAETIPTHGNVSAFFDLLIPSKKIDKYFQVPSVRLTL